jgi:opacity protein-like surface antigen
MKSKFIIATILGSSIIATNANAEQKSYIRFDIGGAFLKDGTKAMNASAINTFDEELEIGGINFPVGSTATTYATKGKLKTSNSFTGGVGFGVYLNEDFRTELLLNFYNFESKGITTFGLTFDSSTDRFDYKGYANNKVKNRVINTSIRGLYDFYKFEQGSLFLSAGVGVSRISSNYTTNLSNTLNNYLEGTQYKAKTKFDVSGHVGAGVSYNITEKVKLDLAYNFNYLGKTHGDEEGNFKQKLNVHTTTLGLRFDI